jgi:hypothetical protein
MEIGPVCALAIMGADIAPAAMAMLFNRLRRRGVLLSVKTGSNQYLKKVGCELLPETHYEFDDFDGT